MSDRTFAFGANTWSTPSGCTDCPAMSAGFRVKPDNRIISKVAADFDTLVRDYFADMIEHPFTPSKGVIPEHVARKCWMELIRTYRRNRENAMNDDVYVHNQKKLERAEQIRRELGWSKENE